jgi:hypothetical protein
MVLFPERSLTARRPPKERDHFGHFGHFSCKYRARAYCITITANDSTTLSFCFLTSDNILTTVGYLSLYVIRISARGFSLPFSESIGYEIIPFS